MTLKQLRERQAFRQVDVASRCNVAVQTVYAWEKGQSQPRPPHIRALAEMYGVTVAEIKAAIDETAAEAGQQP